MIYGHAHPAMHASTAMSVGSYFLRSTLQESAAATSLAHSQKANANGEKDIYFAQIHPWLECGCCCRWWCYGKISLLDAHTPHILKFTFLCVCKKNLLRF